MTSVMSQQQSCRRCMNPCEVTMLQGKGRGVVSTREIAKGELVESSPLISIVEGQVPAVTSTILKDYVFAGNALAAAARHESGSLTIVLPCLRFERHCLHSSRDRITI